MPKFIFKSTGLAAALITASMLSIPSAGLADVTEIVKKRQADMKVLGRSMKTIKNYIYGTGEAADVEAAARKMAAVSSAMTDMFPAGSGLTETSIETEAKAEIWEDWKGFTGLWDSLEHDASKLADLVSGGADTEQINVRFKAIAKSSCAACHDKFRKK